MSTKNRLCVVLSVVALLALSVTCAQADTISTNSDGQNPLYGANASWGPTVNMVNNVLVGLTPTLTTGTWPDYDTTPGNGVLGVSALTDGVLGPIGTPGNNTYVNPFTYAGIAGYSTPVQNTATYTFAATKLSTIEVYGGHIDGPLNRIHYNVDASTDGGATWTALGVDADFNSPPAGTTQVSSSVGKTTLSDDGAGIQLLGANGLTINALRFNFLASGSDYYGTGYLEVAAYKVVPEPSTLALLTAGLIGLIAYAWRKRR